MQCKWTRDKRQWHFTNFFVLEVALGHSEPVDEVLSELRANSGRRQRLPTTCTIQTHPIFALIERNCSSRGVTLDMALGVRYIHRPYPLTHHSTTQQLPIKELLSAHRLLWHWICKIHLALHPDVHGSLYTTLYTNSSSSGQGFSMPLPPLLLFFLFQF